jgi:hypothetical protein
MLGAHAVAFPIVKRIRRNLAVAVASVLITPIEQCVDLIVVQPHFASNGFGTAQVMSTSHFGPNSNKALEEIRELLIRQRETRSSFYALRLFPRPYAGFLGRTGFICHERLNVEVTGAAQLYRAASG